MRRKFRDLQQKVGSAGRACSPVYAAAKYIGLTGLLICLIYWHPVAVPYADSNLQRTGKEVLDGTEEAKEAVSALLGDGNDSFTPGQPWHDDRGALIQAHGGGVLYHEGIYYWFGEYKAGPTYIKSSRAYSPPRVDILGVSCYSSADLVHWYFEGIALKGGSHPDIKPTNVLERPTVLYHRSLRKFVMWMHVDSGDYEWARVGIAIADHITGPYRFLKSFRPHNQESRDCTVFQDDDGRAYLAYASEDNHIMHIAPLTEDYLDVEAAYKRILVGLKREAPTLFKFRDFYLLLTSGCTGWEPNAAEIFYSREIMGEWSSLGNPSAGGDAMDRAYSFFSQPAFVVPIQGLEGRFILAADQWNEMDLGSSRYVWLPMWIEEVPAKELEQEKLKWRNAYDAHSDQGIALDFAVPPGPLNIIVPWLETWSPSIFKSELDAEIQSKYLLEKHDYTR